MLSFHGRCEALRLCSQMACVEHLGVQMHEKLPEKIRISCPGFFINSRLYEVKASNKA